MKKRWNWLKMQWKEVPIDRQMELLIVIGGLIVAGVVMKNGIAQLEQMNRQTVAMEKQIAEIKKGGDDTKLIAESAKTQAENTKKLAEAAVASTTAWIVVDGWIYDEKRGAIAVLMKNVGKTSALDVTTGLETRFFRTQDIRNDRISEVEPGKCPNVRYRPGIIKPDKQWWNVIENPPLTQVERKMIGDGTGKIFIHVCATYREIFSDRERVTEAGSYYPSPTIFQGTRGFGTLAAYSRIK